MTDLIVMRLADMHRVHPRQDSSRLCALCGMAVGIYPSGQAMLRQDPTIRIVCEHCRDRDVLMVLVPGALQEPLESVPANPDDAEAFDRWLETRL